METRERFKIETYVEQCGFIKKIVQILEQMYELDAGRIESYTYPFKVGGIEVSYTHPFKVGGIEVFYTHPFKVGGIEVSYTYPFKRVEYT